MCTYLAGLSQLDAFNDDGKDGCFKGLQTARLHHHDCLQWSDYLGMLSEVP